MTKPESKPESKPETGAAAPTPLSFLEEDPLLSRLTLREARRLVPPAPLSYGGFSEGLAVDWPRYEAAFEETLLALGDYHKHQHHLEQQLEQQQQDQDQDEGQGKARRRHGGHGGEGRGRGRRAQLRGQHGLGWRLGASAWLLETAGEAFPLLRTQMPLALLQAAQRSSIHAEALRRLRLLQRQEAEAAAAAAALAAGEEERERKGRKGRWK